MANPRPTSRRNLAHRMVDVLDAFGAGRSHLTLTDIARRADLPLATVHRLVGVLIDRGVFERADDGTYQVGLRLWELGSLHRRSGQVRDAAMPFLAGLYAATRAAVELTLRDGSDAVVVAAIRAPAASQLEHRAAARTPTPSTAAGRVLLAHAPFDVQERVLGGTTPAVNATESASALRRALAHARLTGVAVLAAGPNVSVAAAVRDPSGIVVASVSVTAALNGDTPAVVSAVRVAAADVSASLARGVGASVLQSAAIP